MAFSGLTRVSSGCPGSFFCSSWLLRIMKSLSCRSVSFGLNWSCSYGPLLWKHAPLFLFPAQSFLFLQKTKPLFLLWALFKPLLCHLCLFLEIFHSALPPPCREVGGTSSPRFQPPIVPRCSHLNRQPLRCDDTFLSLVWQIFVTAFVNSLLTHYTLRHSRTQQFHVNQKS